MANGKPQDIKGYTPGQTSLAERTLVTVWRSVGEYHRHLVLVGGLVPRYLIDRAGEREVPVGSGHCGTMDVDLGVSLAVADLKTYESIRDRLIERLGFWRGGTEEGRKQKHSFVSEFDGRDINIDFLTTKYGGPESKIRAVEKDLSAIQAEGLGLAFQAPVFVDIRAELLTGDGLYTAHVPVCRAVPYIILKALSFRDRGERKDAYDLVYTLTHYQDGPASAATEVRKEERESDSFKHAVAAMKELFASEVENGSAAYGNFLGDRSLASMAYATVQEFIANL
ncbi:MAG: nucleotidyl transferase AbiEii/AbiGii toxin family protein [Kiritimatiellia bacterium]